VLPDIPVTATIAEGTIKVAGLRTYHCRAEGHIFFVRELDLHKPEMKQSEKLSA